MAGIASHDQLINALSNGQTFKNNFGKNFNPTAPAVANEFHTLFRGAGNPPADALFDTGTTRTFVPVLDTTTNAATIQHGGNVQASNYYKYLLNMTAVSAAATVVPGIVKLIDVIGYYRMAAADLPTLTALACTNTLGQTATFTADAGSDLCTYTSITSLPSNLLTGTRVRFTTTGGLPAPLATLTDYYLIRMSDSTFEVASSYANAIAGTQIDITTTGTGVQTITWLLPRYTNGAGVQAIHFNPASPALGAVTPNLSLSDYTNAAQVTGRATPTVLPVGKSGATNSHILYTGATGTGKYNYTVPLMSGDNGIAQINSLQHSANYTNSTAMYTVALIKEITEIPLSTLGLAAERNLLTEMPSLPRIYDGAALYLLFGSGVATPASSAISGTITTVWN
jgi:hypothetical protein